VIGGAKEMVMKITLGNKRIKEMEEALKSAFVVVREELDEHRDSINQNTNEVQSNYEYICKLDSKINKLSERVDELTMFIRQLKGQEQKTFEVSPLTRKEQEVFLVIYMNDEVTHKYIGRRLGFTEDLVECYVENLITKGVPVIKKRSSRNISYLTLDPDFKAQQTKTNILNINETITETITY